MTRLFYQVRELDKARSFYKDTLGFTETYADDDWAKLERAGMQIALSEGEPQPDGPVASIDVDDIKAEADRLRGESVDIGTVLELHEEVRVVDVFDPDGNRVQLAQPLVEG